MHDYISDMIVRIKNGHKASIKEVKLNKYMPKYCNILLDILEREGYILGSRYLVNTHTKEIELKVLLKYDETGKPVFKNCFRISKPGRLVYITSSALWSARIPKGFYIIGTSLGLMTDREARLRNLGGEVLYCIL